MPQLYGGILYYYYYYTHTYQTYKTLEIVLMGCFQLAKWMWRRPHS